MERYVDLEQIGAGSFGAVYRGRDSQSPGGQALVALKVFHNSDEEIVRAAIREARFLAAVSHCNLVSLKEAYRSGSGRVYLVMEYCEHTLGQQIRLYRKGLPSAAVRSIIFQILQALQYLHSKQIMHRDVKPANVLITGEGMVKLCDFGFARYVTTGSKAPDEGVPHEPLTPYVITRWYRPPEVLVGHPYSCTVDIWAVGCILAEMVSGAPLFPGTSHLDQISITRQGLGGLSPEQEASVAANTKLSPALSMRNSAQIAAAARNGLGGDSGGGKNADGGVVGAAAARGQTIFERLAPALTPSMLEFLRACLEPNPAKRATASQLLRTAYMREGAWETQAAPSSPPSAKLKKQPPAASTSTAAIPAPGAADKPDSGAQLYASHDMSSSHPAMPDAAPNTPPTRAPKPPEPRAGPDSTQDSAGGSSSSANGSVEPAAGHTSSKGAATTAHHVSRNTSTSSGDSPAAVPQPSEAGVARTTADGDASTPSSHATATSNGRPSSRSNAVGQQHEFVERTRSELHSHNLRHAASSSPGFAAIARGVVSQPVPTTGQATGKVHDEQAADNKQAGTGKEAETWSTKHAQVAKQGQNETSTRISAAGQQHPQVANGGVLHPQPPPAAQPASEGSSLTEGSAVGGRLDVVHESPGPSPGPTPVRRRRYSHHTGSAQAQQQRQLHVSTAGAAAVQGAGSQQASVGAAAAAATPDSSAQRLPSRLGMAPSGAAGVTGAGTGGELLPQIVRTSSQPHILSRSGSHAFSRSTSHNLEGHSSGHDEAGSFQGLAQHPSAAAMPQLMAAGGSSTGGPTPLRAYIVQKAISRTTSDNIAAELLQSADVLSPPAAHDQQQQFMLSSYEGDMHISTQGGPVRRSGGGVPAASGQNLQGAGLRGSAQGSARANGAGLPALTVAVPRRGSGPLGSTSQPASATSATAARAAQRNPFSQPDAHNLLPEASGGFGSAGPSRYDSVESETFAMHMVIGEHERSTGGSNLQSESLSRVDSSFALQTYPLMHTHQSLGSVSDVYPAPVVGSQGHHSGANALMGAAATSQSSAAHHRVSHSKEASASALSSPAQQPRVAHHGSRQHGTVAASTAAASALPTRRSGSFIRSSTSISGTEGGVGTLVHRSSIAVMPSAAADSGSSTVMYPAHTGHHAGAHLHVDRDAAPLNMRRSLDYDPAIAAVVPPSAGPVSSIREGEGGLLSPASHSGQLGRIGRLHMQSMGGTPHAHGHAATAPNSMLSTAAAAGNSQAPAPGLVAPHASAQISSKQTATAAAITKMGTAATRVKASARIERANSLNGVQLMSPACPAPPHNGAGPQAEHSSRADIGQHVFTLGRLQAEMMKAPDGSVIRKGLAPMQSGALLTRLLPSDSGYGPPTAWDKGGTGGGTGAVEQTPRSSTAGGAGVQSNGMIVTRALSPSPGPSVQSSPVRTQLSVTTAAANISNGGSSAAPGANAAAPADRLPGGPTGASFTGGVAPSAGSLTSSVFVRQSAAGMQRTGEDSGGGALPSRLSIGGSAGQHHQGHQGASPGGVHWGASSSHLPPALVAASASAGVPSHGPGQVLSVGSFSSNSFTAAGGSGPPVAGSSMGGSFTAGSGVLAVGESGKSFSRFSRVSKLQVSHMQHGGGAGPTSGGTGQAGPLTSPPANGSSKPSSHWQSDPAE